MVKQPYSYYQVLLKHRHFHYNKQLEEIIKGLSIMFSSFKPSLLRQVSITAMFTGIIFAHGAYAGSFEDALASAYKTNPNIRAQIENVNIADERVSQAVSGWRPNVTADYSKGRQRNNYAGTSWNYTDAETKSLQLSQPLFNGGETVANTKSAKKNVKAAREDLKATEQQVLLQAIAAYMDVVRDTSVLELSKANQDVLQKQLEASQSRFNVGEVTRTDVSQSEARLARATTDVVKAKGQLESSRALFQRVIGFKPEKLELAKTDPQLPTSLDDAMKTALGNNPSYNAALYREKSAEHAVDAHVASLLPDVSITSSMRREEGAGTRGNDSFDTDDVLLNVSIPLYQSGAEYSRIREAKLNVNRSKYDVNDKHDATTESVTKAWEDYQTQTSAITSNTAAIHAAEVALDGVKQEQLYGSRTVLDVLDAEQELFTARVNLVRAEHDKTLAMYSLLSAIGKLTASDLHLPTEVHNPVEHYDHVKYKVVGF